MAFQNVHEPLQAPKQYTDKYSFIEDKDRRTYAGMVDVMDEAIGNITEAMKDAGYGRRLTFIYNKQLQSELPLIDQLFKLLLLGLITIWCLGKQAQLLLP